MPSAVRGPLSRVLCCLGKLRKQPTFFYQALLLAKAESGGDLRQNDHVRAVRCIIFFVMLCDSWWRF